MRGSGANCLKEKKKMAALGSCLFFVFFIFFLCPASALSGNPGREQEDALLELFHLNSGAEPSILAVPVATARLPGIAASVLSAEAYLRAGVLAHYPYSRLATIVVGMGVTCSRGDGGAGYLLPAIKNLRHALKRWGLESDITVTAAVPACDAPAALAPLLAFLKDTNSSCVIDARSSAAVSTAASAGSLQLCKNMDVDVMAATSSRPWRVFHAFTRRNPRFHRSPMNLPLTLPPSAPPPGVPLIFSPGVPHESIPGSTPVQAPAALAPVPPCLAAPVLPPMQEAMPPSAPLGVSTQWCIARPTVPEEKLQEALNYACGEGGADCDAIMPDGSCFDQGSIAARASYAYNSYWQKAKRIGGSCDFAGTAVLIGADPSFEQCRFPLS